MQYDRNPTVYYKFTARGVECVEGSVIGETRWRLYVNQEQLVTFMCTPHSLHYLALGFCLNEGLIRSLADVRMLRVYEDADHCYCFSPPLGLNETLATHVCERWVGMIDMRLRSQVTISGHRVLTSGCGGGVTFDDSAAARQPLTFTRAVHSEHIFALMRALNQRATLYRATRGVHTSLLETRDGEIILAEDVGRHNTLDKIRGECLMRGIETRDGILVTTGRISSEMLTKTANMGLPIVVSRTSPTFLSTQLAEQWNITAIGYTRGSEMNVYTHPERIIPAGVYGMELPRLQISAAADVG
jgi:FdhD protein